MYISAIPGILLGIVTTLVLAKSEPVDKTIVIRATGPDVVKAVVQRISDSGIFPSDNGILRRIAYVESKDGANANTFRDSYYGGIWQVNQSAFSNTQNTASNPALLRTYGSISRTFNITWSLVTWKDLEKPLYSGLAARLLLSIISGAAIPFSIQDQAVYWKQRYTSGSGTVQQFIQDLLNLEDTYTKCTSSISVDIVLVLDTSGSIGSSNFNLVRSLCINITRALQIENTGTRIGIIGFDSIASIQFNLGQYNTTINSIPYTAGGTRTDFALQLLPTAFSKANGARPFSSGVPKIAVVITDGQSNDPTATKLAADAFHSGFESRYISVYAVGVGSGINYEELQTIASQVSKVKDLSAFSVDQFQDLQSSIIQDACASSAVIRTNSNVSSSVSISPRYFVIPVTASEGITLFLKVNSGAVKLYASFQISTPNSAFYNWMISTESVANIFISLPSIITSTTLYLGIQGYTTDNVFVLSTVSGDASTPQPPSGPPQKLTVLNTSSRTIYVTWYPPLEYHQNGVIDKYVLRVLDKATGETRDSYLFELYYTIDGLYPGRTYSISVQAHNSDGFGPFSDSFISTTPATAGYTSAIVGGTVDAIGGVLLVIVVIIMCYCGATLYLKKCLNPKSASDIMQPLVDAAEPFLEEQKFQ